MSDPLQRALTAFVDPIRIRVYREDTHHGEWQTLPSLFDQLTGSGQWAGGNNGGGAYGSRPVISTGVVALTIEIRDAINEAATDFGRIINHPNTNNRDHTAELRAIAANIPNPDLGIWWTEHLRKWAGQTKAALGLNPNRPTSARGVPCPDCQAVTAYIKDDEQVLRTPALAIHWAGPDDQMEYHEDKDWKVRAVECRACGAAWFRGESLDALVDGLYASHDRNELTA